MSDLNSEQFPEDESEDLLFWLSIDQEGLDLIKERRKFEFIENNKEFILKEKKVESFITHILKEEEKCPDAVIERVLGPLQLRSVETRGQQKHLFTEKKWIRFALPLCAVVIICISASIFAGLYYFKGRGFWGIQRACEMPAIDSKNSASESIQDNDSNWKEILLASFEQNVSNSDSDVVQNKINSKINNLSIKLKEFLDAHQDCHLIGYRENELEGDPVIQIVLSYKGEIIKAVVLPTTEKGITLIKEAIEEGSIQNIKRVDKYFISMFGNPEKNTEFLQYITVVEEKRADPEPQTETVVPVVSSGWEEEIRESHILKFEPVEKIGEVSEDQATDRASGESKTFETAPI